MDSNTRLVLVRKQTPDGSPVGNFQLIDAQSGLSVKPTGDVKERSSVRSSMSDTGAKIGAKSWEVNLPLELKGAGETGGIVNKPEMDPVFLACGMQLVAAAMIEVSGASGDFAFGEQLTNTTATNTIGKVAHVVDAGANKMLWVYDLENMPADTDAISGDTSAVTATVAGAPDDALCYKPTSDRTQHNMLELHAHMDGQRRVVSHARGTFNFDFKSGEIIKIQYSLKGLYAQPTDEALPSADYSDIEPLIAESAGLTIKGYPTASNTIDKFTFALGHTVSPVPDINSPNGRHSFRIAGKRKPTGSIDPEVTALSEFNPFEHWENSSRVPIHATLGSAAGERLSVVVTQALFTGINDQSRADEDVYDLSYRATGENDNEFFMFFH